MKFIFQIIIGIFIMALILLSCSSKRSLTNKPEVPIAITIKASDPDVSFVNLDYYRSKLLDGLDDFQAVNLKPVDRDEKPEVLLDLNIQAFTVWPKDERASRRVFSRQVVVGQDANGKAVYGTVTASADIVQVQQSCNARFSTMLLIKGTPGKNYARVFTPTYRYNYVYVLNIQGDSRAVDPSLYSLSAPPIEPDTYDLLIQLSKQDMISEISNQIRSYYYKKK